MDGYDPQLPPGTKILDLTPQSQSAPQLTPETPVLVINRGQDTIVRKWDGRDYPLHAHHHGLIRMPYGAALHFQKHCTVPGTRDTETGAEQSFLGIIDIDPPEACEPFSRAEFDEVSARPEAILRADDDEVVPATVNSAVAGGRIPVGRGQSSKSRRPAFSRQGQTADGAKVDRDEIMSTTETAQERIERINAEAD